ncbi:putative protein OS=Tsukamurella paurometabola (strain ATCC 8368 / DSM / CCUG 35730 /CIP 100753 / JCM 10117 / KCTC 9821 / NBRC 16120 / NCIMB 702349/ NCTC 13040) OX=521096 GN=Tpau_3340 PE=4 SV=1 [Tsukamurella paurometabola]|uniref:Uncharacterized protein n=1 Tax=Tsukamurella paurometabola (strain ATCC 8368 / DSM 20162 / CCUG 35730 / CIP 100753 / JCM 10117 / KCTC 9821 / NBRC 16120 / NCIMB 702349 / NCTC 13040) TaxID=521096 RepID=D5UWC5_TSUPD|nr:hypothetical protein [Tsukamurella paurometabola]ADG79924.1 hypothetical protein Tpau_3340 [Tsukamurella paurometabola DSM 20162]SUP37676.1 Uncharacterised protein [Tsukamurella paurometabola]
MRTFIQSLSVAALAATALIAGTGMAAATPDDYDYKKGSRGAACSYADGTLGLDVDAGFVITCQGGVWNTPKSS